MPNRVRDDEDAQLERADRFAAGLIARAPMVRFHLALSPEERDALYRLRYQVVVERGWTPPAALLDGIERDADDDHAILVGGWDNEQVVAAGRILYPTVSRLLPVERIFEVAVEPRDRVAHIDRLCVARADRDPTHRVFAALIGSCWLVVRGHGFHRCCGIESAAMARLFRQLGLPVIPLGPPRFYWSELRYPILFDPESITAIASASFGSASHADGVAAG